MNKSAPVRPPKGTPSQVGILSLGHAVTDAYAAFPPPLWPILVAKLGLSLSLVGLSTAVLHISTSFFQLLYGYLADRTQRRLFVVAGPAISGIFMGMIGQAQSYAVLLTLLVLAGWGVAAFHPQATATVGMGGFKRKGLAISIFMSGGSLGYSAGPLIASSFVVWHGLQNLYLLILPGVLISCVLFRFVPSPPPRQPAVGLFVDFRRWFRPLAVIYAISALRASAVTGLITFLPLLLQSRGHSLVEGGGVLSLFLLSGGVGGFVGGALSDRVDRRRLILFSLLASPPLLLMMINTGNIGIPFLLLMSLSGCILFLCHSVTVILAQEILPNRINTVSALMMGASWGTGSLLAGAFGFFADAYGLPATLSGIASIPTLGGILCLIFFKTSVRESTDSLTTKRA